MPALRAKVEGRWALISRFGFLEFLFRYGTCWRVAIGTEQGGSRRTRRFPQKLYFPDTLNTLQLLRIQPRMLRDPRQHFRAYFFPIMKGEHNVRLPGFRQYAM